MAEHLPIAISIGRLKGCGGAYIGKMIAEAFGFDYYDRALVAEVAKQLGEPEDFVEAHDEHVSTTWENVIEALGAANPYSGAVLSPHVLASRVCDIECETIVKAALDKSVVIVGRGASFLLRHHPNHISIFLYADEEFRLRRTQDLLGISRTDAVSLLQRTDADRSRFVKAMCGLEMFDARLYDVCLDTGIFGVNNTGTLLIKYIEDRYPGILAAKGYSS